MSDWIASIFWPMSSVARAVSLASSLTSLATTANPLPASPARAASIVAFSASRFVCCAIEVITLITFPISALDSPRLATVPCAELATATAEVATDAASVAFFAISRMLAVISSTAVATVWMLEETCVEEPDALAARSEVRAAPSPMPWDRMLSCSAATASESAVPPMSLMEPRRVDQHIGQPVGQLADRVVSADGHLAGQVALPDAAHHVEHQVDLRRQLRGVGSVGLVPLDPGHGLGDQVGDVAQGVDALDAQLHRVLAVEVQRRDDLASHLHREPDDRGHRDVTEQGEHPLRDVVHAGAVVHVRLGPDGPGRALAAGEGQLGQDQH